MAAAAQTNTTQSIALQTLASPLTAQQSTNAITQHISNQPSRGIAQQAQIPVQSQAPIQQSAAGTPQQLPASHSAPPSLSVPVPCPNDGGAGLICRFLHDTPIGNAIGLIGLVLTLGLGLFGGISSYRDMRWSEHANAVQTCATLYSIGRFSEYCNNTIEGGIETSPLLHKLVKRTVTRATLAMSPMALTCIVFCTLTAVLLGLIFIRPRMQTYVPIISNVRLEVTKWVPGFRRTRYAPGSKITAETLQLLEEEISEMQEELWRIGRRPEDPMDQDSLCEDAGSLAGEWVCDSSEEEEEDAGLETLSSASDDDEVLPKVQMAEPLLPTGHSEDHDNVVPPEGLEEALVRGDLIRDDDTVSESPWHRLVPAEVAEYFEMSRKAFVAKERLHDLEYFHEEGQEERQIPRFLETLDSQLAPKSRSLRSDERLELVNQMKRSSASIQRNMRCGRSRLRR